MMVKASLPRRLPCSPAWPSGARGENPEQTQTPRDSWLVRDDHQPDDRGEANPTTSVTLPERILFDRED